MCEILVEIAQPRRQGDRFDAGRLCAVRQTRLHHVAGGISIAGDIEPTQASTAAAWLRGDWPRAPQPSARSAAHSAATAWSRCLRRPRARRLATPKRTALPSESPIARRGVSIGALPADREAVRIEPGAVHAGDPAIEIGDGRRSSPARSRSAVLVGAIVAARMEAQAASHGTRRHAATPQVRLNDGARDRSATSQTAVVPTSGDPAGAAGRAAFRTSFRFRAGQAEKPPRLLGDFAEVDEDQGYRE